MTNKEAIKFGYEQLEVFGGDMQRFLITAIRALNKQMPKSPVQKSFRRYTGQRRPEVFYTCPVCGGRVEVEDNEGYMSEYFPACKCGQRIDWDGILEDFERKWDDPMELWEEESDEE